MLWVSLEERHPLHLAHELEWLNLKESFARSKAYIDKAFNIIGSNDVEEEGDAIAVKSELGEPPPPSLPLYLISISGNGMEKVVYVGKTQSENRFEGGHLASQKLLHPKYKPYDANLYRCSITMPINDDWILLDWIDPFEVAEIILDDVESQFIHHFRPELNVNKVTRNCAIHPTTIQIQNIVEKCKQDSFLNDYFIHPPDTDKN